MTVDKQLKRDLRRWKLRCFLVGAASIWDLSGQGTERAMRRLEGECHELGRRLSAEKLGQPEADHQSRSDPQTFADRVIASGLPYWEYWTRHQAACGSSVAAECIAEVERLRSELAKKNTTTRPERSP